MKLPLVSLLTVNRVLLILNAVLTSSPLRILVPLSPTILRLFTLLNCERVSIIISLTLPIPEILALISPGVKVFIQLHSLIFWSKSGTARR